MRTEVPARTLLKGQMKGCRQSAFAWPGCTLSFIGCESTVIETQLQEDYGQETQPADRGKLCSEKAQASGSQKA
jgi:hypothetical protein